MTRELLSLSPSHPICLHLGWGSNLMKVGLDGMRVLQRVNQDAKILYSSTVEKATRRLLGATFSSTSGKCKHGVQSKGFGSGVGVDRALKQRMEEEKTLNPWAWIGPGSENGRKHYENAPKLPYNAM